MLPSRRSLILGAGAAFVTRPARALIVPRNPLTFPGRAPGFNPSHPAAKGILPGFGFSGVASGANFINLLTGAPLTPAVAVDISAKIFGSIGPAVVFNNNDSVVESLGNAVKNPLSCTMAVVFICNTLANTSLLLSTMNSGGGGNGGYIFFIDTNNKINCSIPGGTNITSAAAITNNIPYFALGSSNSGATNIVIKRIDNGEFFSTVGGGLTPQTVTFNGSYSIGGWQGTSGFQSRSSLAAAMWAPSYLTMPQCLAWAAAPWDFWYPPSELALMFSSLAQPQAAAVGGRMPLVGVGP